MPKAVSSKPPRPKLDRLGKVKVMPRAQAEKSGKEDEMTNVAAMMTAAENGDLDGIPRLVSVIEEDVEKPFAELARQGRWSHDDDSRRLRQIGRAQLSRGFRGGAAQRPNSRGEWLTGFIDMDPSWMKELKAKLTQSHNRFSARETFLRLSREDPFAE